MCEYYKAPERVLLSNQTKLLIAAAFGKYKLITLINSSLLACFFYGNQPKVLKTMEPERHVFSLSVDLYQAYFTSYSSILSSKTAKMVFKEMIYIQNWSIL